MASSPSPAAPPAAQATAQPKALTPDEEAQAKQLLQSLMTGDKKPDDAVSELQQADVSASCFFHSHCF